MPPRTDRVSRVGSLTDRAAHVCSACEHRVARWAGRCPHCGEWGTLAPVVSTAAPTGLRSSLTAGAVTAAARPMTEVDLSAATREPTGIGELDRVLGGGLVPGAVVLLAGEPGVGKSTLLLEAAAATARAGRSALIVTGEESAAQVRLRAERTGAVHPQLWVAAETDLAAVIAHIEAVQPSLLVVDSVQTMASAAVEGAAGGVTQVREVAAALTRVAKARSMATVLVGHVTKDGGVAGPRVLEHLVDVVLQLEGERHSALRLLRAVKNRFGAVDEVGCFLQADTGIVEVTDPSGLFTSRLAEPVPGSALTVTLEGRRPLLAEVQALVSDCSGQQSPRRGVTGLDAGRVALVLAVLERRARIPLGRYDVFTATVGGVRLAEPAADLPVALALTSAACERALRPDTVVFGEVGLAGEVRRVAGVERRVAEAARLGFGRAVVPAGCDVRAQAGMRVVEVAEVTAAIRAVLP